MDPDLDPAYEVIVNANPDLSIFVNKTWKNSKWKHRQIQYLLLIKKHYRYSLKNLTRRVRYLF